MASKTVKIVITNYGGGLNKGGEAILRSQISALKIAFPYAKFYVFTYTPEAENRLKDESIKFFEKIGGFSKHDFKKNYKTSIRLLKCTLWRILYGYFNIDIKKLRNGGGLSEYYDADIIINTGGDLLTEYYGTPLNIVVNLLFGVLLKKPVVIYSESVGPFKRWYNKILMRFLLSRVKMIILREKISEKNIKDLVPPGIPIYVTADSAFLLDPAPISRIKEILKIEKIPSNSSLLGISVSKLFSFSKYSFTSEKMYRNYIDTMVKIVDYATEFLGATVVFVPHVVGKPNDDDRDVADEIYKIIKNKGKVILIKNEYTPEELKGIMGRCDLFIGSRMHACIGSLSMCVPTISVAYSQKALGIIGEMLGYKDFVIDIKDLNFVNLRSAVDRAWSDKKKIKESLVDKIKYVKSRALLNVKFIESIINNK